MSTEDKFTPDVTLRRNDAQHRYELLVGGTLAVQSFFEDLPGHIDFIRTETGPDFEGRAWERSWRTSPWMMLWPPVNASSRTAPSLPATCGSTRGTNSSSTGLSEHKASPPLEACPTG